MFRRNEKNERGMALISAIIIIALIAIMSGTLMQMSYLAYTRKVTERRSTETFYTAEAAVDTIKTVLQNTVAEAVLAAQDENDFSRRAFGTLFGLTEAEFNTLSVGDKASAKYPDALKTLRDYLYGKITTTPEGKDRDDSGIYNGSSTTLLKDGLSATNKGNFTIGDVIVEEGAVRIKDVCVDYVNNEGYTAKITTDIVIAAPEYAMKKMDQYPVSSYSMFAGNGGESYSNSVSGYKATAMNNAQYVHQEGNVYCGTYDDGVTALVVKTDKSAPGGNFMSIGGENIVFNGDIHVQNGCTLIFTGGDGRKNANVQVNGYIFLSDGATLLLNSNVHIVCKGIGVKDKGMTDFEEYTGSGTISNGISQFFPATEKWVKDQNNDVYTKKFLTNEYDVAYMLANGNSKLGGGTTADERAKEVSNGTASSAVYVLQSYANKTQGWINRADNKYYKVIKSGADWTVDGGSYNGNIYTNDVDPNLTIVPKVTYKGKTLDAEFVKLINVQVLELYRKFSNSSLLKKNYTNYRASNASSYETTSPKWIDAKTITGLYNMNDLFDWDNINVSNPYGNDPMLGSRTLRIPTATALSASKTDLDPNTLKIETDLASFVPGAGTVGVGNQGGGENCVLNPSANNYCIYVSCKPIQVHVSGGNYAGMFLSAETVNIGYSANVTRGISILEMMKSSKTSPWVDGMLEAPATNPVRVALDTFSGSWISKSYSEDWLNNYSIAEKNSGAAFNIFDNVFANGVESFWKQPDTSGGSDDKVNDADNKLHELIQVDDWKVE